MPAPDASRRGPLASAIVFILLGLVLAGGGAWLIALGGSWYYLLAGLGVLATGVLLLRAHAGARWLFALVLAASAAWAAWEVRLDFWQLLPRLDLWLALGTWLLLPWAGRRLRPERGGFAALAVAVAGTALLLGAGLFTHPHDHPGTVSPARMAASGTDGARGVPANDWIAYGRSGQGDRYFPGTQITPANAGRLERAWTYHTGDFKGPGDPLEIANEVTPLKANGRLYLCTPHNIVIALDPDSGRELWRYDPRINRDASTYQHMICRGVAYYDAAAYGRGIGLASPLASGSGAAAADGPPEAADAAASEAMARECPRRLYTPTADATIVAINADTGVPCEAFGAHGVIGLREGMPVQTRGMLNPTSPPTVTRDVLVVAASVTDNESTNEPSGVIRGYDIDSGRLRWKWDASAPADTAPLAPGETYVRNSPNSWSVASVDEQLGLVYLPMGNETPDIWGGRRDPDGERFSSAIVALDIATGQLRWVYQTVHHDLWDLDIGGQPSLVDLARDGRRVPALVASTKRGDLYVLDRRSGKLLVPAPERPVPQGAAPGDRTSPTQPFSQLTFTPATLHERDMWGTTPYDQLLCRIRFRGLRYEGIFTPPSEQGTLVYPGNLGVFDWGGIAIDPVRQLAILNPDYMAFVSRLHPRKEVDARHGTGSELGLQPMTGTPYAVDLHPLLSPLGVPCQAPPWGYVAAVDLTTMQLAWMHKNGTTRDSSFVPVPFPLGVPSLGGMVTTGGGVAFLGSTLDYYLRAYDVATGRELWKSRLHACHHHHEVAAATIGHVAHRRRLAAGGKSRLPAGGQATPMSYVSDRSGRQFVVVMAGGHGSLGTDMGDSLVAYALPVARQ